jgi:peroxiredoxin-like protein
MHNKYVFRVFGRWQGGVDGQGEVVNEEQTIRTPFSVAEEFGGRGGPTNPEELFLSAACSCYLITLAYIAEKMRLPIKKLECEAEGRVSSHEEEGFHFTEIVLKPHLELEGDPTAHDLAIARAVKLAEQRCIISRAVRGTVKYQINPTVKV